jgi:hypothetical protein
LYELINVFEPSVYNYTRLPGGGKSNQVYNANDVKMLEIQRVGNHCIALVNKKHILKELPDFVFETLEEKKEKPREQDKLIKKFKIPHQFNPLIASWDIEASLNCNNIFAPYACSICWMELNGVQTEKQFWGLDCMVRFLEFLSGGKFDGYTLYAHNGGKFDLNLLMKYALIGDPYWAINGRSCIELNNSRIGLRLWGMMTPNTKSNFVIVTGCCLWVLKHYVLNLMWNIKN